MWINGYLKLSKPLNDFTSILLYSKRQTEGIKCFIVSFVQCAAHSERPEWTKTAQNRKKLCQTPNFEMRFLSFTPRFEGSAAPTPQRWCGTYLRLTTGRICAAEVRVSLFLGCADAGEEVGVLLSHLSSTENMVKSVQPHQLSRTSSSWAALKYRTCLDRRQCMTKTRAPCRLLRMVKMYATTMASFWNRKAPNTHISPNIHVWAIAVTVKALGRKQNARSAEVRWRIDRKITYLSLAASE